MNFMKILQIICFTYLFIFSCDNSKDGEKIIEENKKIVEHQENNSEMYYPVNLNIEKLPKEYSVLDINILYNVLPRIIDRPIFKGEFETTEEFEIRIKKLNDRMHKTQIVGNSTIDSIFTIDLGNAHISYDADNSIMNIKIFIGGTKLWSSSGISMDEDDHVIYNNSTEIGLMEKYDLRYRSFLITNHKKFPEKIRELKINMERDDARQEKENIRVVASIKLVKPWYWHRYSDIPRANVKYIFLEVIQFWIINFKSGEIYKRIVPEK